MQSMHAKRADAYSFGHPGQTLVSGESVRYHFLFFFGAFLPSAVSVVGSAARLVFSMIQIFSQDWLCSDAVLCAGVLHTPANLRLVTVKLSTVTIPSAHLRIFPIVVIR